MSNSAPVHGLGQRLARDPRDLGREEEDYFSAAGDDDGGGASAGGGAPPVATSAGVLSGVSSVYMSDPPADAGGKDGGGGERWGLGSRAPPGTRWSGGESLSVRTRQSRHACISSAACLLPSLPNWQTADITHVSGARTLGGSCAFDVRLVSRPLEVLCSCCLKCKAAMH